MKDYDCIVIGGGPAGLTAALYLCRAGVSVALVEMLAPGGQLLKTEEVTNYPGYPEGIKGWELADTFDKHLKDYTVMRYMDTVNHMESSSTKHSVTVGEEIITAKAVIVCTGAVPKLLGLPKEKELTGRGVSYCALCDGNFFRNQTVAVIGGGDSALEESLYLARIVKKLYLIHRRDTFRGSKIYQDKVVATPNIELVLNSRPKAFIGEATVEGLEVENTKTQKESKIMVDGIFIFIGYEPKNTFLSSDIKLDQDGFVLTDNEMRTSLAGVFAAGDIRSKQCRQITTAVGDGAVAATAAFSYIEQMG